MNKTTNRDRTAKTIRVVDIHTERGHAADSGDVLMWRICDVALGGSDPDLGLTQDECLERVATAYNARARAGTTSPCVRGGVGRSYGEGMTKPSLPNRDDHKLTIEGTGRSTMGRCACGTVLLQSGHGTPRQQVKAAHVRHLAAMAWVASIDGVA